jgi:hypothetical protein
MNQFIKIMKDETAKSYDNFDNYKTPNKIFDDVITQYPEFGIFKKNFFDGELDPIVPYKIVALTETDLPYLYTDECGDTIIIKTLFDQNKFDKFINKLTKIMPVDSALKKKLEYVMKTTYGIVSMDWFRDIMCDVLHADEHMLDLIYGLW